MVQFASFEEIAQTMHGTPLHADDLIRHADEEHRVLGILMKASDLYRMGQEQAALETLLRTRESLSVMPTVILAKVIELCRRLRQEQCAAHECAAFARDAAAMGFDDLALEASSAALILDAMGQFEITRSPAACANVAAMYDQIARRMRFVHRPPGEGPQRSSLRVAMVVPNLIDYVVAYTKRVLHFADRLDPERYELSVYVSENLTARESPLFPFGCRNGSSKDTGARTIEVLQKQRIPLYLGSNTTGFTQTAGTIAGQLVRDRIDIAIFQSGLACPIDWLAARIADIPVKLSIHTGCSLFLPGMDATFMDSPDDMEREADVWTSVHGNRILMHKGTDLKELRRYEAYRRSEFGIPPDAVVIGTMSNHLDARLSSPYMTVLADILKSHSDAWLLFFGAAELPEQMDFFRTQGVGNRVKFGGKQSRSAPALKVLDIYANEFPVGGSQSVMEAIGCGLPVAAMKWSQAHAESVGAEIVGPEYAVPSRDPAAYARLIENWIVNPQQRHEAARKMLARAEQSFSVDSYVQRIMRHAEDIFRRKQR